MASDSLPWSSAPVSARLSPCCCPPLPRTENLPTDDSGARCLVECCRQVSRLHYLQCCACITYSLRTGLSGVLITRLAPLHVMQGLYVQCSTMLCGMLKTRLSPAWCVVAHNTEWFAEKNDISNRTRVFLCWTPQDTCLNSLRDESYDRF